MNLSLAFATAADLLPWPLRALVGLADDSGRLESRQRQAGVRSR